MKPEALGPIPNRDMMPATPDSEIQKVSALPSPSPSPSTGIPEGYELVDMTWSVQAHPNGPYHELNGTIEQVRAQLKEMNPDFERDFPPVSGNATELAAKVEKRSDRFVCNTAKFSDAEVSVIQDGILYLHGVSGKPTLEQEYKDIDLVQQYR
ncbi:MAG: hypothetical protein Q9162_007541 [Coniocarpon cinnabarinum]